MGNKRKNNRAESFLDSIPKASIEELTDTLAEKSKFNFAYFINDNSGQDFRDWTQKQLYELFDKLKEYSKFPYLIGKDKNKVTIQFLYNIVNFQLIQNLKNLNLFHIKLFGQDSILRETQG